MRRYSELVKLEYRLALAKNSCPLVVKQLVAHFTQLFYADCRGHDPKSPTTVRMSLAYSRRDPMLLNGHRRRIKGQMGGSPKALTTACGREETSLLGTTGVQPRLPGSQ